MLQIKGQAHIRVKNLNKNSWISTNNSKCVSHDWIRNDRKKVTVNFKADKAMICKLFRNRLQKKSGEKQHPSDFL